MNHQQMRKKEAKIIQRTNSIIAKQNNNQIETQKNPTNINNPNNPEEILRGPNRNNKLENNVTLKI